MHQVDILEHPTKNDFTTMFVGHDSDLDSLSALLGLTWDWGTPPLFHDTSYFLTTFPFI